MRKSTVGYKRISDTPAGEGVPCLTGTEGHDLQNKAG